MATELDWMNGHNVVNDLRPGIIAAHALPVVIDLRLTQEPSRERGGKRVKMHAEHQKAEASK